jgi:ribose transport system permease protein
MVPGQPFCFIREEQVVKQQTLRRLISLGMLAALCIFFSVLSKSFLTANNMLEIVRDAAVPGIIGVGVTYVIITSGIDLSTGATIALVAMVMANIYKYTLIPIPIMILVGILVGFVCGVVNGLVVAKLHLPEFIGTLATMGIFRALTYIIAVRDANGTISSVAMNHSSYAILGKGFGRIYFVSIAFVVITIIGQIVLKYTRFGTNLYAVGANPKAAELSGINIARTRIIAYIVVGLCAAIGAIFTTGRLQSTTALLGEGFEFNPIAASVIGGVSLSGGYGEIIGTFIGAIFMAALENGVLKLQMNTAYQYVIKGVIIIMVVIFDAWFNSVMEKKAQEAAAGKEA